jgi:hypothetical protein
MFLIFLGYIVDLCKICIEAIEDNMAKLTNSLLKKLISEEFKRLQEDAEVSPQKINATGKLNVELSNLLKAINSFKSKVLEDVNMTPVKDTTVPALLKRLEREIATISTSPGNYVKVPDEKPAVKPAVKPDVVKPSVKVV